MNDRMEIKEITIDKGQRLSDIMIEIESHTILHKTVCGIGATTLELNCPRHSIIIEPNLPVIKGKELKHPYMFGVYEGVTVKMIEKYLYDNEDGYKKIMTTPESFGKVKSAMRKTGTDMYGNFFLLYDECERLIKDVNYRRSITLPTTDFFRFERKAMVSATPIVPSDPRFEEQGFVMNRIVPTYDYRQDIEVIQTNNAMTVFQSVLKDMGKNERVCIFFSSTDGIEGIVEMGGIKDKTSVYCSTESMEKLKSHGFTDVYDSIAIENGYAQLNRYNFFTSRFYSAVDIELEYKPVVIMLTELYSAPHTMIDPATDAIQIAGRFRNGVKRLLHITNANRKIEYMSREELEKYLDSSHTAYTNVKGMFVKAEEKGETDQYRQAYKAMDYSRFILPNGQTDYFMRDNAFQDEQVKGYYQKISDIRKAYRDTKAFNVSYRYQRIALSDKESRKLRTPISREEANRIMFKLIHGTAKSKGKKYNRLLLDELKSGCELMTEAYRVLGAKRIKEIGFSDAALRQAISEKQTSDKERGYGLITAVYNEFSENTWYSNQQINGKLKQVFDTFGIRYDGRGIAKKICNYFDAHKRAKKGVKGYQLGAKIYQ